MSFCTRRCQFVCHWYQLRTAYIRIHSIPRNYDWWHQSRGPCRDERGLLTVENASPAANRDTMMVESRDLENHLTDNMDGDRDVTLCKLVMNHVDKKKTKDAMLHQDQDNKIKFCRTALIPWSVICLSFLSAELLLGEPGVCPGDSKGWQESRSSQNTQSSDAGDRTLLLLHTQRTSFILTPNEMPRQPSNAFKLTFTHFQY